MTNFYSLIVDDPTKEGQWIVAADDESGVLKLGEQSRRKLKICPSTESCKHPSHDVVRKRTFAGNNIIETRDLHVWDE